MIFKIGITFDDLTERIAKMPLNRVPLDLKISFDGTEIAVKLLEKEWKRELAAVPAENRPLTPEKLCEEFASGGSDNFRAGQVAARLAGEWFVPAGELKQLRRDFWEWVETAINPGNLPAHPGLTKFYLDYRNSPAANPSPAGHDRGASRREAAAVQAGFRGAAIKRFPQRCG